jgi:glycolate oxidase FAD binding subunit
MRDIVNALDQNGQELAFEPMNYSRLFAGEPLAGTIGGLVGVNASGPRRIKAGAARDSLLGFRAVSGRGDLFKSGGRVMKNVTGYDLSKLMAGSFGTLGILSEVTVKVLPRAETETTVCIRGLEEMQAIALMCEASGLPFEVSSLAHIPQGAGAVSASTDEPRTLLRLEGPEISVSSRSKDIVAHFKSCGGEFEPLSSSASRALWADIREAVMVALPDVQIWRLSSAPASGARLMSDICKAGVPVRHYIYDWAGGLIWLAVEPAADAHATTVRECLARFGGHATLVKASDDVRLAVDVFQPQTGPLAALTRRVKEAFDPGHILNPGRMQPMRD